MLGRCINETLQVASVTRRTTCWVMFFEFDSRLKGMDSDRGCLHYRPFTFNWVRQEVKPSKSLVSDIFRVSVSYGETQ